MRAVALWLVPVLVAMVMSACASWFPAPEPMRSVAWNDPAANPHARCLVVFLPGMGDSAEDFEDNGFVAEVHKRKLSVDMVAAHATLGYYARGSFPERAATDVVRPARASGYEQLWLIGMSMGGMGTLFYSRAHTPEVTGVLALAPYLGEDGLIDEIEGQGGLARWQGPPRSEVLTEDNFQGEIWRWLQAVARGQEAGPRIYLGFGRGDRLARADELLAAVLPADQVYRIDGGHDWGTWKVLLGQFLDSSEFARSCRR